MSSNSNIEDRPFWLGPLGPIVMGVASVVFLLQDGLRPYKILYRRAAWEQVSAMPAKVSIPIRRTTIRVGLNSQDSNLADGKKSALAMEERGKYNRGSASGKRGGGAGSGGYKANNALNKENIYEKKVFPERIYSKYVEKGFGTTYKVQLWYVKLAFKYNYKGKIYSVYEDSPSFSFESREEAERFLQEHSANWPIKVWVNPGEPKEATAFLIYKEWHWIQLGVALAFFTFLWGIVAGVGGKQYREEASPEKNRSRDDDDEEEEVS